MLNINNNINTLHFFNKIHQSEIIISIFTYLSISNVKNLLYVNKKFRNLLLKNDQHVLKEIGYLTYGLNKQIPFPSFNSLSSSFLSFKSNHFPITLLCLIDNKDIVIVSPGSFENGIYVWNIRQRIYKYSIINKSTFAYCVIYIDEIDKAVVSYSDGNVVMYQIDNEQYDIIWDNKIGVKKPIERIAYDNSSKSLFTLEVNSDVNLNFIKEIDIKTGNVIKSAVIRNSTVINMKIISMKHILTHQEEIDKIQSIMNNKTFDINIDRMPKENYLILSLYDIKPGERINVFNYSIKDTKLAIKNISLLESDFTDIQPEVNLYGHTAIIKDFIYNEKYNILISVGVDLYVILWDMYKKNAKCIFDSFHEDIINSICEIDDMTFSTCGKDRTIFIWKIDDILNKEKRFKDKIQKNTSDIYAIEYSKRLKCLIAGSFDKSLQLHSISSEYKCVNSIAISGHNTPISSAKFDFVHMQLITASLYNTIIFWDLKTMSMIKSIELHKKEYIDDFIPLFDDIDTIIKIDNTKKVKCLNSLTEEFYYTIEEKSIVRSILKLYDGVSFMLGLSNGDISIYSYYSKKERRVFIKKRTLYHNEEEDKEVKTLRIEKLSYLDIDSKLIASGGNDGSVCVFDMSNRTKKVIKANHTNKHIGDIIGIKFTKEEKKFAFFIDDTLYLYDLVNNQFIIDINLGRMLSIERLNENYLLISYQEGEDEAFPGIFLFDLIYTQNKEKLNVSCGNNKIIKYMKDGKSVLVVNGSANKGFGIDVLNLNIIS